MEDLSVWRVLGQGWSFLRGLLDPVFDLVGAIPWAFGDWTIFTALALPLLASLGWRAARRGTTIGGFKLMAVGFVLGGIIEHFQPFLERCLSGHGCS